MRGYLVITGILVVIIVSLISLNISYQSTLQMEMAEQFNKQQLLLAKAEAFSIQAYINKVKDEMLRFTQHESMSRISREALYTLFTDGFFREIGKVDIDIKLLDSEAKILFTHGDMDRDMSFYNEIINTARRSCPGEVPVSQDTKMVYIVTPVCRSGSLVGAVLASINIQDLAREVLSPVTSGTHGYAWMMDGTGNLLYHPTQPMMIGRNLYKTDASCFKCHKSFDVEKKIIEGKGDYYGKYVAPTGEDKVLAYSAVTVGDSKWIVAVSAPYSEVTMPIQTSMRFHSWFIILIFMATSIGSALLIILNKKRVKAEEDAKHKAEIQRHAEDLEHKVNLRTKELTEEKEKLNTVVSAIGSGIILVDNSRKILWTNRKMNEMAGQDITGMLCDDFFSDCTIIGSYTVNDMQTDMLSNLFGQEDKFFQVTTAPLKDTDNKVHGYIRLVNDVTEMKRMEEQMMHSEKLALLGRLTSGIAHEIGNPLTSVLSIVQVLKSIEKDEFKKESIEIISSYMNRIADILKQLSGFSKMPPVELKPWRLNSLIESSLSLMQYDKRVKDITIMKDLASGIPDIVTDRNLLSQVVVNLVLNAADAMPDGGTLTIRSRTADNKIIISFEDTGTGMAGENLARIFDPFYTTKEKGTGLGLAVSQSIIEKLNGSLTAESEISKGSKFVITLPVNGIM